ncbi:MAG: VOC family protein [Methanobacteriota archaeon]|nr:MAG: VOC family protein [Euryarchaeota archaeon]
MARRARRAPTRKKSTKRTTKKTTPTTAAPRGIRTVTPYLVIDGASKAIEFYKRAFGAKEVDRSPMPDGTLMHATIRIGDSIIMMSDEFPGGDSKSPTSAGSTTVNLHISSKDVDKLWNQALNAGAKPTLPLENQFWGERYGKLQDPFGHIWSVSMAVKMSEQEKAAKRQAAFAMMGGGEPPGSEKSWT